MNSQKAAEQFGIFSLVLAVLAFVPAIAPFTPALLGSVIAFFGAIIGAAYGQKRIAILTIYIVIVTFLVSPASIWIEQFINLSVLVVGLIIGGVVIAISLFIHYRRSVG